MFYEWRVCGRVRRSLSRDFVVHIDSWSSHFFRLHFCVSTNLKRRKEGKGQEKGERRKSIQFSFEERQLILASLVLYKRLRTHKKNLKIKYKSEKFSLQWYSQKYTLRALVFAGLSVVNKWLWLAVAWYLNACEKKGKKCFFGVDEKEQMRKLSRVTIREHRFIRKPWNELSSAWISLSWWQRVWITNTVVRLL